MTARLRAFHWFGAAVLTAAAAGPAWAQAAASDPKPSPEIAVGVGRLPTRYGDIITQDLTEPTLDVGVTVPFGARFALEGIWTVGRRNSAYASRTEGLFVGQVRQRLPRLERDGWRPFLTYGAAGYYGLVQIPAAEIPQPGGIVIHRPATSFSEVEELVAMLVGGGVQRRLHRRAAFRVDAQFQTFLWQPLGGRFFAGVSLPLGGGFQ